MGELGGGEGEGCVPGLDAGGRDIVFLPTIRRATKGPKGKALGIEGEGRRWWMRDGTEGSPVEGGDAVENKVSGAALI